MRRMLPASTGERRCPSATFVAVALGAGVTVTAGVAVALGAGVAVAVGWSVAVGLSTALGVISVACAVVEGDVGAVVA